MRERGSFFKFPSFFEVPGFFKVFGFFKLSGRTLGVICFVGVEIAGVVWASFEAKQGATLVGEKLSSLEEAVQATRPLPPQETIVIYRLDPLTQIFFKEDPLSSVSFGKKEVTTPRSTQKKG